MQGSDTRHVPVSMQVMDLAVSPNGKYVLASTDHNRAIMLPVGKVKGRVKARDRCRVEAIFHVSRDTVVMKGWNRYHKESCS